MKFLKLTMIPSLETKIAAANVVFPTHEKMKASIDITMTN